MVDQSGSMEEPFAGTGVVGSAGTKKADAAASIINNVLRELVKRSTNGTVIRPRVDIAILGYGPGGTVHNALSGALSGQDIVSITDLANNPLEIKNTVMQEFDPEMGQMVQIPMDIPIWIKAVHDNGTPMCMALEAAAAIAYNWASGHPDNFPPIIVNVTDGAATDGDPRMNAARIGQISTNDGVALLFNCHITSHSTASTRYPSDISQVPQVPDDLARIMFEMSSPIPDGMLNVAMQANPGAGLQPGARGFVFGGEIGDLVQFITIASLSKADR
jgi:hypothetical protein